jgi:hypothetical protein
VLDTERTIDREGIFGEAGLSCGFEYGIAIGVFAGLGELGFQARVLGRVATE